jgi:hypothetical protein
MKHLFALALVAVAAVVSPQARASSVSANLTITIQPPLTVAFNPAAPVIPCSAPAGTVVAAVSASGGNGSAATFAISSGDKADFAISGSNIVVGPNGVAASACGNSQTVGVTATQQ